ncbi:MAG: DinB family protein [Chitinophagaceae bacterium]
MNKTIISYFQHQLAEEAVTTRAMLKIVPADKYDWQPHPKSMSLLRLATHVAEIAGWVQLALDRDVLDFATTNYQPEPFTNNKGLMDYFESRLAAGTAALKDADDSVLSKEWVMRNGEQVYYTATKGEVLRMSMSQLIHHRAQLGVYLRLLNVRIPGSYGPSADEMEESVFNEKPITA